jgi:hypothetical protein
MARAMRSQIATLSSKVESSALSASLQRPLEGIANCKRSTPLSYARSIKDPLFSFSLARISLGLTCGDWRLVRFAKPSSRPVGESLHSSGFREWN